MLSKIIVTAMITLISSHISGVTFSRMPTLEKIDNSNWEIEFTVSDFTDVTVTIVNIADSTVVRRLASGVLGGNPPPEFTINSKSQTILWDGLDDTGKPVAAAPQELAVRVQAGLGVRLAQIVGDDPNTFVTRRMSNGTYSGAIDGVIVSSDGTVFVSGMAGWLHHQHYMVDFRVVRQFDKNGNYIRTIFPFPSNLPYDKVKGWGVVVRPDGSIMPKQTMTSLPSFTTSILSAYNVPQGAAFPCMDSLGRLLFGSPLSILAFEQDGALPDSASALSSVKSPEINRKFIGGSSYNVFAGNMYMTRMPGTNTFLLSGMFHAIGPTGGMTMAPDTNFYRDGSVFKFNPATGIVTRWLAMDSIPQLASARATLLGGDARKVSAIMGTAVDAKGRIYVCDRFHKQIGVYNESAELLSTIAVNFPERVAVSRKTGAVYVLSRFTSGTSTGNVQLRKFSSVDSGASQIALVTVYNSLSNYGSMDLNETTTETRVWVGLSGASVKIYTDNGATLDLYKDFAVNSQGLLQEYDRIALDRNSETLYLNDYQWNLYKIFDWNNPVAFPCSSTSGRLYGTDVAIGNGYLYVHEGKEQTYNNPITRYTLDRIHRSAPWSNNNTNVLTPKGGMNTYIKWGGGTGDRGFAVAPNGNVAHIAGGVSADLACYIYSDSSHDTIRRYDRIQIKPLTKANGGVKFDTKGNLYVGALTRTTEHVWPSWYGDDASYNFGVGSIVRFNKNDSGSINATGAPGSSMIYSSVGYGALSYDVDPRNNAHCCCHSPRFDIDGYGRLFVPDALTNKVSIVDNNGNIILQFGKYGNSDSRGGLSGPGALIVSSDTTDIPLAWVASTVASDNWIYASDFVNCRLVRLRMVYGLDNMTGFDGKYVSGENSNSLWRTPLFKMTSGPMPFSEAASILISIPSFTSYKFTVHDVSGRMIRTLGSGNMQAGIHRFLWDGKDNKSERVSAGMYIFKFVANEKKTIVAKTIFTR